MTPQDLKDAFDELDARLTPSLVPLEALHARAQQKDRHRRITAGFATLALVGAAGLISFQQMGSSAGTLASDPVMPNCPQTFTNPAGQFEPNAQVQAAGATAAVLCRYYPDTSTAFEAPRRIVLSAGEAATLAAAASNLTAIDKQADVCASVISRSPVLDIYLYKDGDVIRVTDSGACHPVISGGHTFASDTAWSDAISKLPALEKERLRRHDEIQAKADTRQQATLSCYEQHGAIVDRRGGGYSVRMPPTPQDPRGQRLSAVEAICENLQDPTNAP
jgi:hypothetical protein